MNELVTRQRQLIDNIMKELDEIQKINQKITDDNFKTDILCLIGQHRHQFEEEKVFDHTKCISVQYVTGTYEGICGSLMFFAHRDPLAARMVRETFRTLKNNLS